MRTARGPDPTVQVEALLEECRRLVEISSPVGYPAQAVQGCRDLPGTAQRPRQRQALLVKSLRGLVLAVGTHRLAKVVERAPGPGGVPNIPEKRHSLPQQGERAFGLAMQVGALAERDERVPFTHPIAGTPRELQG